MTTILATYTHVFRELLAQAGDDAPRGAFAFYIGSPEEVPASVVASTRDDPYIALVLRTWRCICEVCTRHKALLADVPAGQVRCVLLGDDVTINDFHEEELRP